MTVFKVVIWGCKGSVLWLKILFYGNTSVKGWSRLTVTFISFKTLISNTVNHLTHISLVDYSTLIYWMSPFPILGVAGELLYSISNRNFSKQTVKTPIRRRILRRLIWVCTVCLCHKNGTLGLYGLIHACSLILQFFYHWLIHRNSNVRCMMFSVVNHIQTYLSGESKICILLKWQILMKNKVLVNDNELTVVKTKMSLL